MSVAQLESREIQIEAPSGLWREAWHRLIRNPAAITGFGTSRISRCRYSTSNRPDSDGP